MTVDAITKPSILQTKHSVLRDLEKRGAVNAKWGLLGTSQSVSHFWNWAAVLVLGLDQEPASRKAVLELTLNHRGYIESFGGSWITDMWSNIDDLAVIASMDASYAEACLEYAGKNGVPGYFKKAYRVYLRMVSGKKVKFIDRMKLAMSLSGEPSQTLETEIVLGVMTMLHARVDKGLQGIAKTLQDRFTARFGESIGAGLDRIDRNGPYRVLCDMAYMFKWESLWKK